VEPTISAVSTMARHVIVHYQSSTVALPEQSRDDACLRWAEAIVATDQRRHGLPLGSCRRAEDRVQGCCRDHSLLAVAALRHHGVPARPRVGFASYLAPDRHVDHVIVEAWLEGRWHWLDPECAGEAPGVIDPADIAIGAGSAFQSAARVWLEHRAGRCDVTGYGVWVPGGLAGEWFVHGYVIGEAAHRFGDELLLWDIWGSRVSYLERTTPAEVVVIDEIASFWVRADEGDIGAEHELFARYQQDDRLHPGTHVYGCAPDGGTYRTNLVTRQTTLRPPPP
jgi:hypothetical protein